MYCAYCGTELEEGANFCGRCGARSAVPSPEALAAAAAGPGGPAESEGSVSKALSSGRSRSRLRMSPLILLVLALALTAGAAFAAYYVYSEVYLPAVEQRDDGDGDDAPEPGYDGGGAGGAAVPDAEAATFTFEYKTNFGDGRNRFFCPIIECSEPNEYIDELNARLANEIQEAVDNSYSNEEVDNGLGPGHDIPGDGSSRYITRRYYVTYLDENVISIWKVTTVYTPGAAYSGTTSTCETINLQTGEPIDPEAVIGIDKDELYDATIATLSELPSSDVTTFREDDYQEVRDYVSDSQSHYYLVPGGIAVAFALQHEFSTFVGENSVIVYVDEEQASDFEVGEILSDLLVTENLKQLPQVPDIQGP